MTRWAPVLPVRLGLPIAVNVSLVCDLNGRPGGGWNDLRARPVAVKKAEAATFKECRGAGRLMSSG
jgi:hypothetical protein